MQISMSIWPQVVRGLHMLVTHLGQILVVISIPRRKFENANQHEYLASGGACDAHVGHPFGPEASRDCRFVSKMLFLWKAFWALTF